MQIAATEETLRRGTRDFPVEYHFVNERHSRYQMASHWHLELEVIRLLSGSFDIYLDDELYTLGPGDIVFVDAGVLHGGRVYGGGEYECIVFNPELIRHRNYRDDVFIRAVLHYKIALQKIVRHDEYLQDPVMSFAVSTMFSSLRDETRGYELEFNAALRLFFSYYEREGLYTQNLFAERNGKQRIEQMKRVLEYIDSHYQNSFTLDELASVAGLSKRYFCSFFKELTGRTCFEYIRLEKMENAAIMLCDNEKTISEVGYAVGFEDTSYFARTFKSYMGLSPRDYRKQKQQVR